MYYIILLVLLIISIIVNIIQYRRQLKLEDIINSSKFNINETYEFFNHIANTISHAYLNMQRIDKKGAFSHDDEVGFTFKGLNTILIELKEYINGIKAEIDSEKKEK